MTDWYYPLQKIIQNFRWEAIHCMEVCQVFVQWTAANLTHFCTEKQWQYIANHIHQLTSVN